MTLAKPLDPVDPLRLPSRAPAVALAVSFGLGIALDSWLAVPAPAWFLLAGMLLSAWMTLIFTPRFPRLQLLAILLGVLTLGAIRHHQFWSLRSESEISLRATEAPQVVLLEGRVCSSPRIRPKKPAPPALSRTSVDRTVCLLECEALVQGEDRIPVTGTTSLTVLGHFLQAEIGDKIRVQGELVRPRGPGNPGEFDYRIYLRKQGALCLVSVEHPDLIEVIEQANLWQPSVFLERWLQKLRREIDLLIVEALSPKTVPVATALFLGDRTHLEDDLQEQFVESGTLHMLAISGLHVGIFSMLLLLLCRMLNFRIRTTCFLLLGLLWFYAALTDLPPSVVRATILISLLLLARLAHRRISLTQALSLSALILLWRHPTDLFNAGAQLSFLSVIAILWAESLPVRRKEESLEDKLADLLPRSWWSILWEKTRSWLWEGYKISGAIWLFTTPLVAWYFQIISPIGLIVNVLLMPLLFFILAAGYLWLLCALLVPWLSGLPGWVLDQSLGGLLSMVEYSAQWKLGHIDAPAPSAWWLVGYYSLLMLSFLRWKKVAFLLWGGWLLLGLAVGLLPHQPKGLRVTFIDVGHGGAVLVECPNGRALLYDAGALNRPDRTRRIIQGVLWSRGISGLDGLLISHADIDHFNAVPEVLDSIPVASILVSRQFLDSPASSVEYVLGQIPQDRMQILSAGTRLHLDESVNLLILHPPAESTYRDDNEASLVLLIEYAGRRILLTADVEEAGWAELSQIPIGSVDILQSPHHGSLAANHPELIKWANPTTVIASAGSRINLPKLQEVLGGNTEVRSTSEDGALTITISPRGELSLEGFRK